MAAVIHKTKGQAMTDLDKLRPEVRCALGDLSYIAQANHTGQQQVDTVRAELLRLAAELAAFNERRGLLTGTTDNGLSFALYGTPESVSVVSDALEALSALKAKIARAPWTEAGNLQCMPPHAIVGSRGRVQRWDELDAVRLMVEK